MAVRAGDDTLLSRVEDAGLNASAPPQQRWLDGWLLRFSPGKAKRARCINAVGPGRLSIAEKLALALPVYREAALPLVIRVTPFSHPPGLDDVLAAKGLARIDDTRVMLLPSLEALKAAALHPGYRLEPVGPARFAQTVGQLRGSPMAQRQAHAQRLELAPVPFQGVVLRDAAGVVLACGQYAMEAELVGLYDVFTATAERNRGLAAALCTQLLVQARAGGARVAYLQVEGDNAAARRVYHRLGFADAYAYHYRTDDPAAT